MIEQLWSDIADFETNQRKLESDNEYRAGARMEAYSKLQDNLLDKIPITLLTECE